MEVGITNKIFKTQANAKKPFNKGIKRGNYLTLKKLKGKGENEASIEVDIENVSH